MGMIFLKVEVSPSIQERLLDFCIVEKSGDVFANDRFMSYIISYYVMVSYSIHRDYKGTL